MDVSRVLTRFAPAAALVFALATAATAQPPGGFGGGRGGFGGPGGGPGGGIGMLLRSDEVRAELELVDDQVEKLQAIEEEMRDKIREEMGGRRGGGRPDFEAMRATFDEMRKEVETKLGEVLTTQQMDRLRQIETQQQINNGGARSLMNGPLADKLGLTDEQKQQMREKAREVEAAMREKMAAARAEAREELLTVLTSEQRATLEEMTGTPFSMSEQPQFGGRGGFDRGDRGGRRGDREGGRGRGGRGGGRPAPADEPEL